MTPELAELVKLLAAQAVEDFANLQHGQKKADTENSVSQEEAGKPSHQSLVGVVR